MALQWVARKYRKRRDKLSRKKAKIVRQLLAKGAAADPAGPRLRLYSFLLSRLAPSFRALPLSDYTSMSQEIGQVADSCEYVSETPRRMDDTPLCHNGAMPVIMARRFSQAWVTGTSSAIATRTTIAIPAPYIGNRQALITDSAFLLSQENGVGIVHCPDPQPIAKGIVVFGSGAFNWYHWLIEILPAAFLAEKLPAKYARFPLLVPEPCGAAGTFMDSVALFAGDRPQIVMPAGAMYQVEQLVMIDPVVNGPMNMRAGYWPRVTDYSQSGDVLLNYRAAILDRLGLAPERPSRRVFLARSNDRRSFNQADLIAIAERQGFEAVYPERMTFREQVKMYAEADILLGASGAAFANMLFCQPGAQGLTWLLPQYDGFCAYSNLARVAGVTLNYLFVTPQSKINSSFDAYSAAYSLDPSDFEAALRRF